MEEEALEKKRHEHHHHKYGVSNTNLVPTVTAAEIRKLVETITQDFDRMFSAFETVNFLCFSALEDPFNFYYYLIPCLTV